MITINFIKLANLIQRFAEKIAIPLICLWVGVTIGTHVPNSKVSEGLGGIALGIAMICFGMSTPHIIGSTAKRIGANIFAACVQMIVLIFHLLTFKWFMDSIVICASAFGILILIVSNYLRDKNL